MKDLAEQIGKSRKVALYVNMEMEYEFYTVSEVIYSPYDKHYVALPEGELRECPYLDGYTRVTEPVEIALKGIGHKEIMTNAIASLDETERKLMVETETKLAKIREQKQQLLALAYQPEAA